MSQGMWIGSLMPLSALIGGIAGGPLIEYIGRKKTILATAFPFIGGKIIETCIIPKNLYVMRSNVLRYIYIYTHTYLRYNERAM